MLILISGGAASGKSEYAEQRAVLGARPLTYLATMKPTGLEAEQRISRHRKMREGKGFETIECTHNLKSADVPKGGTILLECLSNLCANECFGELGFCGAKERILKGIDFLLSRCETLVVVTNEIFSDGETYDELTLKYIELLGQLNHELAIRAQEVWEICCEIPIKWKGRGE